MRCCNYQKSKILTKFFSFTFSAAIRMEHSVLDNIRNIRSGYSPILFTLLRWSPVLGHWRRRQRQRRRTQPNEIIRSKNPSRSYSLARWRGGPKFSITLAPLSWKLVIQYRAARFTNFLLRSRGPQFNRHAASARVPPCHGGKQCSCFGNLLYMSDVLTYRRSWSAILAEQVDYINQ